MAVLDSFTACYDLAVSPTSFSVVDFALNAISCKKARGCDKLKIVISPGPDDGFRSDGYWTSSVRRQMFNGIVVPVCLMAADEVEILTEPLGDSNVYGFGTRKFGVEVFVEQIKFGNRSIRPKKVLPKQEKLITITLREAEHHKHRNSNVPEWLKASSRLWDMGYEVVFIRDTNKAKEFLETTVITQASYDLDFRAALYRSAYCNLFINNGPAYLCMAIDAPTIIYRMANGNGQWWNSENFWKYYGVIRSGVRDSFPGAPSHQRIVIEEDTADNIIGGFLKWRDGLAVSN